MPKSCDNPIIINKYNNIKWVKEINNNKNIVFELTTGGHIIYPDNNKSF